MARIRISRRKKQLIALFAVLAAFVTALAGWSQGPTAHPVPRALPTGTATQAATPAPSRHARAARGDSAPLNLGGGIVPDLPVSRSVDPASLPAREVLITVTSDAAILRMGYVAAYAHPEKWKTTDARSPIVIRTVARGYGLVAAVGAQTSPLGTWVACSVTVDGVLRSTQTVHGGWAVATCLG